jgi:hypothetical protein
MLGGMLSTQVGYQVAGHAMPSKPALDYTYRLLQCVLLASLAILVGVAVLRDGRSALPLLLKAAR